MFRFRKTIAVFLLINFICSVAAPSLSYALTAGPTAPEATSFEPVDTTDMVDLKTGDFTYNLPLLEVPGPAGSYPLALSYHAGIQPDQEASWTGLGWTLNPGSISRLVNGYPDDHNNVANVDRSFWEGGETKSYTVGLSVGVGNVATVSAGMTFAHDTYRGYGQGIYGGIGVGYQMGNFGANVGVTFGVSPYGDTYQSVGVNAGLSATSQIGMNISANVGLSANTNSGVNAGAGAGVGFNRFSLLDASIGTNGSKASLSIGNGSVGVYNSKSNKVSSNSKSFQVDIPVYYGINIRLGRDYTRYWIDESVGVNTFGSLYFNSVQPNFSSAFDTYDLLDPLVDMARNDNEEKVLGGSFPDVDYYSVTGQGIAGNIRPYHFQKHLYRQDKRAGELGSKVLSKSYVLDPNAEEKKVEFRFVNDFSNRLEYTPADFAINGNEVSFKFDDKITTGETGKDGYANNHLAGSKHVEWYTNLEILGTTDVKPFEEGFVDTKCDGFQRDNNEQIGGFSVTNSSGVTYHYALPAYTFNEYMKSVNSETKQSQDGLSFNEVKKPKKYAYTWYLTAVTGPDFIDRNSNGLADKGDWGYWVNFEYKKWLSDYKWRNPGIGTNRDIDGDFEFFSSGNKEIYYLDKIFTESHVAVFETSARYDGREVANSTLGGFDPGKITIPGKQQCYSDCESRFCQQGDCKQPEFSDCQRACEQLEDDRVETVTPRPMAKLDKINLYSYEAFAKGNFTIANALRSVKFEYDYSLALGTPNSYDETSFDGVNPPEKKGKLTLTSVNFLGKGGASNIPPLKYRYKNAPYAGEKTDIWGFYKNDFDPAFRDQTNDFIGRLPSASSAQDVDAWSLNSIQTSLGATITVDYESDSYSEVALEKQQLLRTKQIQDYAENQLKVNFWEGGINLSEYFKLGQEIDLDVIGAYFNKDHSKYECKGDCEDLIVPYGYNQFTFNGKVKVISISTTENSIVVENEQFYRHLKYDTKVWSNGRFFDTDYQHLKIFYKFHYSDDQAWPDFFAAGLVSISPDSRYGGGIRVKSIGVTGLDGEQSYTDYEYSNGTTSYEPLGILSPKIDPEYAKIVSPRGTSLHYKRIILEKLSRQIGLARVIPGPGVLYKSVIVKERNIADGKTYTLPSYSKYEFETFTKEMVNVIRSSVSLKTVNGNQGGVAFNRAYLNNVTLKDYSARVGNLKTITLIKSDDNTPISKTTNRYLHDGKDGSFDDNVNKYEPVLREKFANQGVVHETFARARIMWFDRIESDPYSEDRDDPYFTEEGRHLLGTISKWETFPSVPLGQLNKNYKTQMEESTQNLKFDFYSGEVTQTLKTDSYGTRYITSAMPAYRKYSAMGLKVYDKKRKNMLTQLALETSTVLGEGSDTTGLVSARAQTWSNKVAVLDEPAGQHDVWRKQSSYEWNGSEALNSDGTYKFSHYNDNRFNFSDISKNTNWEKTNELTLYDHNSHALEITDINGNHASTRMNPSQQTVIASSTNASYYETAYSGAEHLAANIFEEGGVMRGDGNPSTSHSHTGKYSLLVGFGNKGFNYSVSKEKANFNRRYTASVWVYAPGDAETQTELSKIQLYYTVDGVEKGVASPVLQKNKSKSWYLLALEINPAGGQEISVSVRNNSQRGVYFDDFRFHPVDASLLSYVYDPFTAELNYVLDNKNFYTKYEYDPMGRLIKVSRELLNYDFGDGKESFRPDVTLKEMKYNYGRKE